MPHVIAIEAGESQRRQLQEKIADLTRRNYTLTGKFEAGSENKSFSSWGNIFENAISPGLFAAREIIVIENADFLGEFPDDLQNFLEADDAICVLIFIFTGSFAKNLESIADKIEIIKSEASIPPWEKQSWLLELAKKSGLKLNADAAQLLADSIESQEELRSEISKLALYASGREIKLEDVKKLSFDEGGGALLSFLDGVCERNILDVAKSLHYLRNEPLLRILTALANRLRPALIIACFSGSSVDLALKASGTDPVRRKYALKKARAAIKNFGSNAIKRFMLELVKLSYLEKTSGAKSWQGFELLLWEFLLKK